MKILLLLFIFLKIFIYLAVVGLSCGMWDLVPDQRPPALGAQSLRHWTVREVSLLFLFKTSSPFSLPAHFPFWLCKSSQQWHLRLHDPLIATCAVLLLTSKLSKNAKCCMQHPLPMTQLFLTFSLQEFWRPCQQASTFSYLCSLISFPKFPPNKISEWAQQQ